MPLIERTRAAVLPISFGRSPTGRTSGEGTIRSPLRPDGQLVASRIREVKPPATGEIEGLPGEHAARCEDCGTGGIEIVHVDDGERLPGTVLRIRIEAARHATIRGVDIVGAPLLETPPEDGGIELLDPRDGFRAASREFDVVDLIGLLVHADPPEQGRDIRREAAGLSWPSLPPDSPGTPG